MMDPENVLKVQEVLQAVTGLKNHKAVGADGIPVEVYKVSPAAFNLLYKLLARVWKEETMPSNLGVAIFKMLYKRKGSSNNPAKYRCRKFLLGCSTRRIKFCQRLCYSDS